MSAIDLGVIRTFSVGLRGVVKLSEVHSNRFAE